MPTATLSSKSQITIPAELVRALGLKAGDKLSVFQVGDHLAIFPKPTDFVASLVGSMKGFWGSKEEIDRYIEEVRYGGSPREWREEVEDLVAGDEVADSIVKALSARPKHVATRNELSGCSPKGGSGAKRADGELVTRLDVSLEKLIRLGAVRQLLGQEPPKYRLVSEFVRPAQGVNTQ
jgi:AbrB family looped-hinge helix DNA binding protein